MTEVWHNIPELPHHQISTRRRVRSLPRTLHMPSGFGLTMRTRDIPGKILTTRFGTGHRSRRASRRDTEFVVISMNGRQRTYTVDELMVAAGIADTELRSVRCEAQAGTPQRYTPCGTDQLISNNIH